MDSEHLQVVLTADRDGVQGGVYSSVIGERINPGVFIPPEGEWQVEAVIDDFKEDTQEFLATYFGEIVKPTKRMIDCNKMLVELKRMLRRIKKGLPPLR